MTEEQYYRYHNVTCLTEQSINGVPLPCRHLEAVLSEEKSRIASRIEHMFVNAPETYWAIKQIIYN